MKTAAGAKYHKPLRGRPYLAAADYELFLGRIV